MLNGGIDVQTPLSGIRSDRIVMIRSFFFIFADLVPGTAIRKPGAGAFQELLSR